MTTFPLFFSQWHWTACSILQFSSSSGEGGELGLTLALPLPVMLSLCLFPYLESENSNVPTTQVPVAGEGGDANVKQRVEMLREWSASLSAAGGAWVTCLHPVPTRSLLLLPPAGHGAASLAAKPFSLESH